MKADLPKTARKIDTAFFVIKVRPVAIAAGG
jgi:hypothetical protein